jgi:hypothetical protein
MGEKTGSIPPPVCKAILICQQVVFDPDAYRLDLLGILDTFRLASFPGRTMPFTLFTLLTGAQGEQELWIEAHDLRSGQRLGQTPPDRVSFADRTAMRMWSCKCPPLLLPEPGSYDLILYCAAGEIDRLSFVASLRQE